MPHYYFDQRNGRRIVDAIGLTCADDIAAIAAAKFIAVKIAIDSPKNHDRHVAVINAAGDEIFKTPIRTTADTCAVTEKAYEQEQRRR